MTKSESHVLFVPSGLTADIHDLPTEFKLLRRAMLTDAQGLIDVITAEASNALKEAARDLRTSSPDASSGDSAPQSETIGGQVIIRHPRKNQSPAPAPSTRRVIASPVNRGATPDTEPEATAPARTAHPVTRRAPAPGNTAQPITRRAPAPVRIATGKPVGEPSEEIVKPATVDLVDRFSTMVAAGTSGPKPEKLVLFGDGSRLYGENGKPRVSQVALKITTKSKRCGARRATASKRNDGFKQRGGLEVLANLLPSQEPAADAV